MMTVALRSPKDSLLGTPTGELVLRIRGTARNGQEVRLKESRCTVGSAPGCTLRLVAKGVEPQHCVLLRGVRGTIVRRLAPDTRLNGRPFEDAPLKTGDVLGIGPLDFEVVTSPAAALVDSGSAEMAGKVDELLSRCNLAEAEREHWEQEARDSKRLCDDLRTELASERAVRQLGRDSLQSDLAAAKEQFEHDRELWEKRRAGADRELAQRVERSARLAAEQADREAALETARQELTERQVAAARELLSIENRQAELDAVSNKVDTSHSGLEQRQRALDTKSAELEALQSGLEKRRLDLEATARDLTDQRCLLDNMAEQIHTGRATLEADRQQLTTERQRLIAEQQELAGHKHALAEDQQRLEAERNTLQVERLQIEELRQELDDRNSKLNLAQEALDHDRKQLGAEQEQLASARVQLTADETQLAAARKQWETDQAESAARFASAVQAQTELAAAQAEIAEQRADLDALLEGQDAARQRLDEQTRQLQNEKDNFAAQQSELAELRAKLAGQQHDLEVETHLATQSRQQAEQLQAEAELERQQLVTEQTRLTDERQQLAADRTTFAAEQAALVAAQAELAAEKDRIATERESLGDRQHQVAEAAPDSDMEQETAPVALAAAEITHSIATEEEDRQQSSPPAEAEISNRRAAQQTKEEDVFARLRAMSLLREGDHATVKQASRLASDSPAHPPAAEIPTPTSPPAETTASDPSGARPAKHEGEESIDDYMAQLFARLNGDRSTRTDAAPTPTLPKTPATARPTSPSAAPLELVALQSPESETPEPVSKSPVEPPASEYLTEMPRRNSQEKPFDLTAMRELANMSANSAIGASQRRRWTSSATIKLGAAIALGAMGVGLLFFATSGWAGNAKPTLFGFGAVLFVAGAVWLLQGLGLLLMASRSHGEATRAASDSPRGSNVVKVPQVVADTDVVQDTSQTS